MTTGRLVFTNFQVPTAAQVNGYLSDRRLMRFATAATRTTAIPSPEVGMVTWRENLPGYEYWNGSSWVAFSFSSPAQTVTGMSSIQTLTAGTLTGGAADTWSSWISGGTSPGSTSYMTSVGLATGAGMAGFSVTTGIVIEFSRDGGSTVWKRAIIGAIAGKSPGPAVMVNPRSMAASSTVHYRFKLADAQSGNATIAPVVTWTQTAPSVLLTVAESLWETTTAGSAFGTWTTLGTVSGAHRFVACTATVNSDGGLASGAGNTVIARWIAGGMPVAYGHNRAVPSGALKASGYGARCYVLTEPV